MTRNPSLSPRAFLSGDLPRTGGWLRRVAATAIRAQALARQRRALLALDDRLLSDIGCSRDEARAEAERPLWTAAWDAPRHWRN